MNNFVLEKKANDFRSRAKISHEECLNLDGLLQKLNVLTVFKPLKSNFSGMAIKIGNQEDAARFVLINSAQSLGKQHFTICHELYHLFIQESFTSKICNVGLYSKERDIEEYYADVFASHLLLPEVGIKAMIPDNELAKNKIALRTILKLEQYFGCSRAALLYRLKQLKIIDRDGYDALKFNVKKGAVEHGYSISLYDPNLRSSVIGDYGALAKELFDKEKTSESHYVSLLLDLGMNVDQIEAIYNGEEEPNYTD